MKFEKEKLEDYKKFKSVVFDEDDIFICSGKLGWILSKYKHTKGKGSHRQKLAQSKDWEIFKKLVNDLDI